MKPEEHENEGFSKGILNWLTLIGAVGAALSTIVAVLFPNIGDNAQRIAYALTIVFFVGSAGIFAYQKRRKSRLTLTEPVEPLATTAALRGLLPFEEGDQLRGRAHDVQQLYTLITSRDFRFGVLWGESGCGKTSLLRAGLVPKLRQNDFLPLYVAKPTQDPRLAIRAALSVIVDDGDDSSVDIKRYLASAVPKGKKIVVILDQFEELFLTNRAVRSRTSFIKWLGECVADRNFPVVFFIGIRVDFFAYLQEFASHIDEPTSVHTTYQLHNFYVEQAKQILSASAKADSIQFEASLIETVVQDLDSEEQIRPAELQIVATRLKHKNVLTLNRYETLGRAKGILSSYISEEIKRSANEQAARLILRLMCSESGEAKSPTDLSLNEIVLGVSGGPAEDDRISIDIQPEQIENILKQFISARILIRTDDNKYNLIHDYLALYIHTATLDTETNTERSNRLLRRYIAEYKEDSTTRVPFVRLRELQKYASLDVKSSEQAQNLIRKSELSFYSKVSGLLATLLIIGIALFYVSFVLNPIGQKKFDVPVNVTSVPSGLILVDPASGEPIEPVIYVEFEAVARLLSLNILETENLEATADLSPYADGLHNVPIKIKSPNNIKVREYTPSSIQVRLVPEETRTLTITTQLNNQLPFLFELVDATIAVDQVVASGPQDLMAQVAQVVAPIELQGQTSSFTRDIGLVALNEDGEPVVGIKLAPDHVKINVQIATRIGPQRTSVLPKFRGQPAPGYTTESIDWDPKFVEFIASEAISVPLETEPIDLSGRTESFSQTVRMIIPNGIQARLLTKEVTVSIPIVPFEIPSNVPLFVPILPTNLGQDLQATANPPSLTITVSGTFEQLSQLANATVQATVDLSGLGPGTYQVPVGVQLPPGLQIVGNPPQVTVTITTKSSTR